MIFMKYCAQGNSQKNTHKRIFFTVPSFGWHVHNLGFTSFQVIPYVLLFLILQRN